MKNTLIDIDTKPLYDVYLKGISQQRTHNSYEFMPRGIEDFKVMGSDTYKFTVKFIEDDEAHFISLFGLFVDINSGNLALGYFPRNDYIYVGNIYKKLSKIWLGKSEIVWEVDWKYILQLLKIDPYNSLTYIQEELREAFCNKNISNNYMKSEVINIYREYVKNDSESDELRFFDTIKDSAINSIIEYCYKKSIKLERLSKGYFRNFIVEQDFEDFKKSTQLGNTVFESTIPNLEELTNYYISKGINKDFILALKSYGFRIKTRNTFLNLFKTKQNIYYATEYSSMLYSIQESKETILAYNFMDMIYDTEWCQNLIFSIEYMIENKTSILIDNIFSKYNIDKIIEDMSLDKKKVVIGICSYLKDFLPKRDCCTVYDRLPNTNQYCFISSTQQIYNAGLVFNSTFKFLDKVLSEEG